MAGRGRGHRDGRPASVQLTGELPKVGNSPVTVEERERAPSPTPTQWPRTWRCPKWATPQHLWPPDPKATVGTVPMDLSMAGQWDITVRIAASGQVQKQF